ncbi:ABC transporter permease [Chelatococcus asaccharovorans]|uniref:Putative spermidine/putrescine transport system permease protein n=1 Tax=Chelatococcus asaccharovorans TaxID=28210 RepID=A0A2V3U3E8_9HYPH|nr:ABC transporter permease [Chelatococcus asaccharovorans]PXW57099.1 putative spermidine/putrescine transport system permease protein [Chelatococcus asaccharovorans]
MHSSNNDRQISHGRRAWLYLWTAAVLAFLVAPSLIVIPMSFSASNLLEFPPSTLSGRWYASYFSSSEWMRATAISLSTALLTVLIATPVGFLAAYAVARTTPRLGSVATAIIVLPTILPHIVVAVGMFFVLSWAGLINTITGLTIGHVVVALPFVFVVMLSALKSYDFSQEKAAVSLGASQFRAVVDITLPQLKMSLVTAALLAFISSIDEVIISMLVSTGSASTLSRRMLVSLTDVIDPTIAAISTLFILVTVSVIVIVQLTGNRSALVPGGTER